MWNFVEERKTIFIVITWLAVRVEIFKSENWQSCKRKKMFPINLYSQVKKLDKNTCVLRKEEQIASNMHFGS
jgi:hypothetical protein